MFFISVLPTTETFNKQKAVKTFCKFMPVSKAKERRDENNRRFNNHIQN